MLRMESANQEIDGRPLPQLGEDSRPKTRQGFGMLKIAPSSLYPTDVKKDLLKNWVEENLDLYKVSDIAPICLMLAYLLHSLSCAVSFGHSLSIRSSTW